MHLTPCKLQPQKGHTLLTLRLCDCIHASHVLHSLHTSTCMAPCASAFHPCTLIVWLHRICSGSGQAAAQSCLPKVCNPLQRISRLGCSKQHASSECPPPSGTSPDLTPSGQADNSASFYSPLNLGLLFPAEVLVHLSSTPSGFPLAAQGCGNAEGLQQRTTVCSRSFLRCKASFKLKLK